MPSLAELWNFSKRNKKTVIATSAGVLAAAGAAVAYLYQNRSDVAPTTIPIDGVDGRPRQKRASGSESADRMQARRHYVFDTQQRSADDAARDMVLHVLDSLQRRFDVQQLVARLADAKEPAEKLRFWEAIKIASLARTVAFAHTAGWLIVALKAQISILAADLCDQADALATAKNSTNTLDSAWKWATGVDGSSNSVNADRKIDASRELFLQCIQFFVTNGAARLADWSEAAASAALASVSLAETKPFVEILRSVHAKLQEDHDTDEFARLVVPATVAKQAESGLAELLARLERAIRSERGLEAMSTVVGKMFAAAGRLVDENETPPRALAKRLPRAAAVLETLADGRPEVDGPLHEALCSSAVHHLAVGVFNGGI